MNRHYKEIFFAFALVVCALIFWHAVEVFFLAFATILLAILLNAMGRGMQKLIRLPYILSLLFSLCLVVGLLALVFWLYSPLISTQFQLLAKELPDAIQTLRETLSPFFTSVTLQNDFSLTNQKFIAQLFSVFSTTLGSLINFAIFLIVGFYLALLPDRYLKGVIFLLPDKQEKGIWEMLSEISKSLRYWLLGKVLSMVLIGILTFIGLWFLNVSLAFILGFLAGLLTFIPYLGAIIAAIPAVLIAFAESPVLALYVILLYIGVHILEGYLITPFIEQRTVSIPPALTIMGQILIYVLVGFLGLALATPLIIVVMTLIKCLKRPGNQLHIKA